MGLSFYFLITLSRFFSAHEYGFQPVVERLPFVRLPFVEWKSRRDLDLQWEKLAAPAPTRLPAPRPEQA